MAACLYIYGIPSQGSLHSGVLGYYFIHYLCYYYNWRRLLNIIRRPLPLPLITKNICGHSIWMHFPLLRWLMTMLRRAAFQVAMGYRARSLSSPCDRRLFRV